MENTRFYGATACFTKAGLTGISGGNTTFSTGSTTLQYAIGGKAYSKSQVSDGSAPTTDADTGDAITLSASQARAVVWALDASGDVQALAGEVVDLDADDTMRINPQFPGIDLETYCPFAYQILTADSTLSGTFTFGDDNWNTSGMSHDVQDVSVLPSRPQSA